MCDIPWMHCIALSVYDRNIYIWDMDRGQLFSKIRTPEGSSHTIRVSLMNKYIISIGFENIISVWKLDISKDYTRVGRLTGHFATVTALDVFDEYNLFITCDDYGFIKSWDISTFRCI